MEMDRREDFFAWFWFLLALALALLLLGWWTGNVSLESPSYFFWVEWGGHHWFGGSFQTR